MARDDEDVRRCLEVDHHGNAEEAASQLRVERVDLNRDGHADYLVNPGDACSGIGANNVPLFTYLWTPGGYRMLFDENGLGIRSRKTLTNGYFDISVWSHASGNDMEETVYKFKGGSYQALECLTHKYDDARHRFFRAVRHPC